MKAEHILHEGVHITHVPPTEKKYAEPLVFIHGGAHASWCWKNYQEYFAKAGWHTYAFDWFSHGKSNTIPEEEFIHRGHAAIAQEELPIVVDYLKQQNILEVPAFIAHSMGGLTLQLYLQNHPATAAVLLAPVAPQQVGNKHSPIRVNPHQPYKRPPFILAYPMFFQGMSIREASKYRKRLVDESPQIIREANGVTEVPVDNVAVKKHIRHGMLVISAGKEMLVKADRVRATAAYYDADYTHVPGAGHDGLLLGPQAPTVMDEVDGWLRGVIPAIAKTTA